MADDAFDRPEGFDTTLPVFQRGWDLGGSRRHGKTILIRDGQVGILGFFWEEDGENGL